MDREEYKWGGMWKRRYILYAIAFGILFVSFMYVDTKSIVCYQVTFGETLLDGKLLNFYDACVESINYYTELGVGVKELGFAMSSANWDFIVYIILGIWGFPLVLIKRIFHIDPMQCVICMIYAKSIYIAALAALCKLLYEICHKLEIKKEKAYLCIYLFLNSLFLYTAICINGQADILGIVFIMLGINYYLSNKKLGFIISFALAVSCKSLAFFIFLPCLLLKEKNILKILGLSCFSLASLIINDFIFAPFNPIGIAQKQEFTQIMFEHLLYYKLPVFNASVPLLLVLWGIICVFCYLKEVKAFKAVDVIYVSALVFGIILIFYNSSAPYRYIWIAPFLALLTVYYDSRSYYLILFETLAGICLTIGNYIEYYWCFEIFNTSGTFLNKIFGKDIMQIKNPITLQNVFAGFRSKSFEGIFYAIFIVCLITFFIVCCSKNIFSVASKKTASNQLVLNRVILNLLIAYIPFILCVINILRY